MKHPDARLLTPLYVKVDDDMPMPDNEPAYYVLSSSGLFLCRSHPFFTSCVDARTWPTELAPHDQALQLRYPKIRQSRFERIIGFFARVFETHGAEAAVILLWDNDAKRLRIRVPPQRAKVWEGWAGQRNPIDVHYDLPEDLDGNLNPIGTIHSHGDGAAYASHTDKQDEDYRAGLHIVVGRISNEPPEFHCEFVVDGVRFRVDPAAVTEGYRKRRCRFPRGWLRCVEVEVECPRNTPPSYYSEWGNGPAHGSY